MLLKGRVAAEDRLVLVTKQCAEGTVADFGDQVAAGQSRQLQRQESQHGCHPGEAVTVAVGHLGARQIEVVAWVAVVGVMCLSPFCLAWGCHDLCWCECGRRRHPRCFE